MTWIVDAWFRCPNCGRWQDGASVFGTTSYRTQLPHTDPLARTEGLEDGLRGTCEHCGRDVVVRLEMADGLSRG